MKRVSAAILVVLLSALLVFIPARPAQAAENCETVAVLGLVCLTVADGQAVVTGPGLSLTAPVPIQEVPVYINVPGPTISVPGPPVTIPGPTVTVPGPTRTVQVPGPTVTQTQERTTTETQTTTAPARTPGAEGSSDPSSATITVVEPGEDQKTTRYIKVTVPQAVGLSLLALILGAALTILALYIMYRIGQREGEQNESDFLNELSELTRRKR